MSYDSNHHHHQNQSQLYNLAQCPPQVTCTSINNAQETATDRLGLGLQMFQQPQDFDQLNRMRERLFRLLSKVPIRVETVRADGRYPATSQANGLAPPTASERRGPRRQLSEPLVVEYYHEKSLSSIIELHFASSLMDQHLKQTEPRQSTSTATTTTATTTTTTSSSKLLASNRINIKSVDIKGKSEADTQRLSVAGPSKSIYGPGRRGRELLGRTKVAV